ncbi:M48 family metallopeptidase [Halobacillus amylolyticus]|uniref:M48 family metallopeptidase n=1 Tax=Halobacillus amylolyticus TaxID=2932259 RepID=A0ABY4H938_9BACI|nr:M48 family metallopeptidase [Halobacillus amylolyticus]UOR10803.1 M48 family metallopeptidase [Halobacillus amylolyticus]
MKKRFVLWTVILFPIYAYLVYLYLFHWTGTGVPASYQGTAADPATFMTAKELELSQDFSRYKDFLFFVGLPLEGLIYLGVLIFGVSPIFKQFGERLSRFSFVKIPIYVLLLSAFTWILTFPIYYAERMLSVAYGISTQSFSSWMRDELLGFWIGVLIMSVLITVLYWLMKRFTKRWWLYAWILLIPFLIFMMYIQPVVIDPLYNDFSELDDPVLQEKILNMADEADIPAERVYEVDMSEKTNAMNAYVNGIGSNLRIVLWDTTLNHLKDREVLFIMAHEIGHYVMNHLYYNLAGVIISSLVGLYLAYRLLHMVIRKWGSSWGVKNVADISSLPALFIILSLLSFAASPIELAISRDAEKAADMYAIEMTEDKEAAVGAFQELTVNGLTDVNPPALVKFFRYGHPTMMERILMLKEHGKE